MKRSLSAAVAASIMITGCGGGGGNAAVESPDPSVAISENNALLVSKVAYESSLESRSLADSGGGIFFGNGVGQVAATTNSPSASKIAYGESSSVQIPFPAQTVPCAVAGSQTISGDIADPITPTLTAGDYFQTVYSACDEGLNDIKDGILRLDIDAFSGDFLSQLFSFTATVTMTNLQIAFFELQSTTPSDVVTSNGAATVTIDTRNFPFTATEISGNSLTVDSNSSFAALTNFASSLTVDGNLLPSPYTSSSSGTLDSSELAGVVRYSNPVPFEGFGAEFPGSGELLVDGLGSNLRLVADSNVDVRILIDLGADGTIDEIINTTWVELTSP